MEGGVRKRSAHVNRYARYHRDEIRRKDAHRRDGVVSVLKDHSANEVLLLGDLQLVQWKVGRRELVVGFELRKPWDAAGKLVISEGRVLRHRPEPRTKLVAGTAVRPGVEVARRARLAV